jgi:serine protease Do
MRRPQPAPGLRPRNCLFLLAGACRSRRLLPLLAGACLITAAHTDAIAQELARTGEDIRGRLLADEANTVEIVREYGPSVVAVQITVADVRMHPFLDPGEQQGGGSGFVIDEDGRIITNYHVVFAALEDGTLEPLPDAEITVTFLERQDEPYAVRVVGANPDYDLALLEFTNAEDIPAVQALPLGDSNQVRPGQKVIAIGTPFGLHSTVTTGIVSAIEREQPGLVGIEIPFIQTDAAINPGNSGGPLLDSRGEVIGINNAILASAAGPQGFMGVGFAVPVNLLRESLEDLRQGGFSGVAARVGEIEQRPRLGITAPANMEDYPQSLRRELELPEHGVMVAEVTPGGPADQAGLRAATDGVLVAGRLLPIGGDVIIAIDGLEAERLIDLQQQILDREAGDIVNLTLWRDGQRVNVQVTLDIVAPAEPEQAGGPLQAPIR